MKEKQQERQYLIKGLFLLSSVILLLKAGQLQVFSQKYKEKADATTIEILTQYPSRGLLYDRNGKLLVNNEALYDLTVTYNLLDPNMDTLRLCQLLEIDITTVRNGLNKDWNNKRFSKSVPFAFLKKIQPEIFGRFREHIHKFPGFNFVLRNVRGYPHQSGAHVLGYISEVNQQQIDQNEGLYEAGDYAGTSGLESHYEEYLRGKKGLSYILKDNLGRKVGPFNSGLLDSNAISGRDLIISLDLDLQSYAEDLMANKKGSIVAIEPATGEILAMVSSPSYDPSLLTVHRDRGKAFQQLNRDTLLNPFFNRSIMAQYPPGSVIKPVWALIALQEGVLTNNRYINCNGGFHYNNHFWGCHSAPGPSNVKGAIQKSCNTFFYITYKELVERDGFYDPGPGLDRVEKYLHDFGMGRRLGVDINNEQTGLVPNDAFYKKMYASEGGRWYSTYIISNGIGQGEIELTTLQMANLAAILANRGFYYTPHILKGFKDKKFNLPANIKSRNVVPIDANHFIPVVEGMESAITAGTAGLAYLPGAKICGKTGTSENPHGKDHSVFYAFAPKENPEIAIAVYIENGGWGGSFAAPIASLLIEKYLFDEVSGKRQWLDDRMKKADLIQENLAFR